VNAAAAGHTAEIALLGEAAYLVKDAVVDSVQGVGFPPLRDLFDEAVRQGIPIHV
jgi:predicted peroxiredoxin